MVPGYGERHGGQYFVILALVFKTDFQYFDGQQLALVFVLQYGSGQRQAHIPEFFAPRSLIFGPLLVFLDELGQRIDRIRDFAQAGFFRMSDFLRFLFNIYNNLTS